MRDGLNPALEKRRTALAAKAAAAITFEVVAEELIAKRVREGMAPSTARKLRWIVTLLGRVRTLPVNEIDAVELLAALRKVEASGRYETASGARPQRRRARRLSPRPALGRAGEDDAVVERLSGGASRPDQA